MSLLVENASRPKSFLWKWVLYVVAGIFVALNVLFFLFHNYVMQKKDLVSQNPLQIVNTQADLDKLYMNEANPLPFPGTDPYNYGLSKKDSGSKIAGYLLMTAKPVGSNRLSVWQMDTTASTTVPKEMEGLPNANTMIEYANVSATSSLIFLSTVSDASFAAEGDAYGIHLIDMQKKDSVYLSSASSTLESNLAMSPNKKYLAFSSLTKMVSSLDRYDLNNRQVRIINVLTNKVVTTIDGAYLPKWSPDSSTLIFEKSDGFYSLDLATLAQQKVLTLAPNVRLLASSMFDISPNGKYFVYSVAHGGVIVMNEISSWAPFTFKELGRIHVDDNTEYYWPQFSPDSNYYAIQAIDTKNGTGPNRRDPRLEIRATLGRDVLRSYPLDQFDFNALFTNAWVKIIPKASATSTK